MIYFHLAHGLDVLRAPNVHQAQNTLGVSFLRQTPPGTEYIPFSPLDISPSPYPAPIQPLGFFTRASFA